jgi:hypothetical protein
VAQAIDFRRFLIKTVSLNLRAGALAVLAVAMLGPGLIALPVVAQASPPQSGLTAGRSLKNDVSAPLSSLQASPVIPGGKGNHSRRPLQPSRSGQDLPTSPATLQNTPIGLAIPSTSTNFEGVNNLDGVLPPDTNGDIGPNHYVQWVNLHFKIFNRAGTAVLGPSAGNTLWSGFGGNCEFTNHGDPIVRYDRTADRWVFTQFAFTTTNGAPVAPFSQCFAVSTTADPTGTYYRYEFVVNNTYFNDYPKLGVWPDAYYLSVNYFNGNNFAGGGALAFNRGSMLSGQPAGMVSVGPIGALYGGMLPSDLDGFLLPPAGSPNYFGAVDTSVAPSGSTFQIWKFHVDWTTPTNSTFGTPSHAPDFNLTVATYRWFMCNGSRNCVPQPGTSVGVDVVSDRLMNRLQYRRFADGHESLVANHTVAVGPSSNRAAVRWYEIRNLSSTPTVYQQGTYAPGSDNRWMGSIAMDQSGDIALGYSVSSSTVYPSIRYTGRLGSDPLATLPQGEASIIAGSGSQTSTFSRWGDYSMMAVDPVDDCTFWYTQEYYSVTSNIGWQTRVGAFKFPSCGTPPAWAATFDVTNTPTSWTANQSQTYSVKVTNAGSQTWPAGGSTPVHLGVHFATRAGGYPANYPWLTDQRFTLPADLVAGASATLTIAVTPPGTGGNDVLEYQMVKETQFWFSQYAAVPVTVQGGAASWAASYNVTNTPTSWNVNQTQTYAVTVTNTGNQTWPSAGGNPVHLGVHFGMKTGGYPSSYPWLTDQRFTLPADLAPAASVTLTIAVTAPGSGGSEVLEYQMVKENQFWFSQFSDVAVTVQGAAPTWTASYDVTNTPTAWTANQTQTYTVTITNSGNQIWPAAGADPVRLGVHFATRGGGFKVNYPWLTDQRFTLPADLAPGASVTLTIAVTAPSSIGNLVLEHQMVKEHQFWFNQFADVSVVVA